MCSTYIYTDSSVIVLVSVQRLGHLDPV